LVEQHQKDEEIFNHGDDSDGSEGKKKD
jgi:hypothetical protein